MWVIHRHKHTEPLRASYLDKPKTLCVEELLDYFDIIAIMEPNDYACIGRFKTWTAAEKELVNIVMAMAEGEKLYRVGEDA